MVADALSRLPFDANQDTKQKSTYQKDIVTEINVIEEKPKDNFPMNLKLIINIYLGT